MLVFMLICTTIAALAHTLPAAFVIDWMAGDRAAWQMAARDVPTVYLTYDDGPNPATTPDLLDLLAEHGTKATFFLIDEHITAQTAPIVRRIAVEGHAIGLHTSSRRFMIMTSSRLARVLEERANRIEALTGTPPCRAFRPHAGWRSGQMYVALGRIDYQLVGFGWMLWDFNWFRPREADSTFRRIANRASDRDIIVMHDGDESAPTRDQRHTVDATRRLIPALRARGFAFGTIC